MKQNKHKQGVGCPNCNENLKAVTRWNNNKQERIKGVGYCEKCEIIQICGGILR